jgi:hypothetical protein
LQHAIEGAHLFVEFGARLAGGEVIEKKLIFFRGEETSGGESTKLQKWFVRVGAVV